ncbi:MAG: hypothetical protein ACRC2B_02960, partial [Rubrivivax sp.]
RGRRGSQRTPRSFALLCVYSASSAVKVFTSDRYAPQPACVDLRGCMQIRLKPTPGTHRKMPNTPRNP